MALIKKLKKGGVSRWVLKGATSGDYFIVPRGFRVDGGITIENTSSSNNAGVGTLSLGRAIGVVDVYTITVTSAYTGTGTCTWGGGVVNAGTVVSATQATAIAALAGGVTGAAQLAASAAAIALNQPTLTGIYGNVSIFNVTAVGATIVLTGAIPGGATPAPTLSSTGAATFSAFVHTITGSVDTTYLSATPVASTTLGAITQLTLPPAYAIVPSTNGYSLNATFTNAAGAAGSYYLNSNAIAIPNSLTAPQTGVVMGGRSFYQASLTWAANNSTLTINGVAITTGAAQANTTTALNAAFIPGWMIIATTSGASLLTMIATRSGATPAPTIVVGTAVTIASITSVTGFYQNGYLIDSTTQYTNTIAFTGAVTTTAGVYALNGFNIPVPLIGTTPLTANNTALIVGGRAWVYFTIDSTPGTTLTNFVNGVSFVPSTTTSLSAAALATLANVPGWSFSNPATNYVVAVATASGYTAPPVFSAGTGAVVTTTVVSSGQGFTVSGYTVDLATAGSAKWTGPSPVFNAPNAPGTQTYVCTFSVAATGSFMIQTDQQNPGAQAPTLSGALTTQTYTQSSYPADIPLYLNFSHPSLHGNVNVTMDIRKFS